MHELNKLRFRPYPVDHYSHAYAGRNFVYRLGRASLSGLSANHLVLGKLLDIVDFKARDAHPSIRKRWKQATVRMNKRFPVRASARYFQRTAFANIPRLI